MGSPSLDAYLDFFIIFFDIQARPNCFTLHDLALEEAGPVQILGTEHIFFTLLTEDFSRRFLFSLPYVRKGAYAKYSFAAVRNT